jgi:hypothetical protein
MLQPIEYFVYRKNLSIPVSLYFCTPVIQKTSQASGP